MQTHEEPTIIPTTDRVMAELEHVVRKKGRFEETDIEEVLAGLMPAPKWTGANPPAVACLPVYVTGPRLREWKQSVLRPSLPFEVPDAMDGEIWRGYIRLSLVEQGTGAPCVACGRAIESRCVVGCCADHTMHVDCWAVTSMLTKTKGGCMGSAFSSCVTAVWYDIVGMAINPNAIHRLRLRRDPIKLERNRTTHDKIEECMRRAREWLGTGSIEHRPMAAVRMGNTTCAMCGLQGPLMDERVDDAGRVAMIGVCGRHTVHSACYAYWRSIRERVDECGTSECPGRFFSELSCIHSLHFSS